LQLFEQKKPTKEGEAWPTKRDDPLDTVIAATIKKLQDAPLKRPEKERRVYYTVGVVLNFLDSLSESPRLTKAQREQIACIVETWDSAIFSAEIATTKEA
jgi:hypothetical protein